MTMFHYAKDASGQPAATPIGGAHAGLAAFLTEEATSPDYVDLLLDSAAEAARGGKPQVNTGNAYAATVHPDRVVIEHLHKRHHAAVTVPTAVFTQALREWRAFLATP